MAITKIEKRDGRVVDFDQSKITNAILKAIIAVGEEKKVNANVLSDQVVEELQKGYGPHKIPNVEDIQDVVEKILIKNGHTKIAKAYILYRQKKAEIREEKKKILNKDKLDEIDKRFSVNALRVLAYRYLIKDENGAVIESPRELFQRVAIHIALPEILYDPRVYDKKGGYNTPMTLSKYLSDLDRWDRKIKIGKYPLNKWHLERFIAAYEELANEGKMKIGFDELITMMKNGTFDKYEKVIDEYFNLMTNQIFMPNTPTLVNAGRKLGMLSACFTLDVEDSIESIMNMAKDVALIQKAGGGTGVNFSKIRPEGDLVRSTMGKASGPLSFMKIIDTVSDVVKQGGVRRGANMGILEIWHPDIDKFISAKDKEGEYENFNFSVGIWEDFWEYLANEADYPLLNPRTKKVWKEVNAKTLFHSIAYHAWLKADPGVLFFDNINKRNVLVEARGAPIRVTNPCGEEPLYPYESCNLASINVAKFIVDKGKEKAFDWKSFKKTIKLVARALDNLITMNKYPVREIDIATKETRRTGLGIMGLADLLFELNIRYNSKEGYELMSHVAEGLTYHAFEASVEMAKERGTFPLFKESEYVEGKLPVELYYHRELWTLDWDNLVDQIKKYGLRNAMVTTNAPTGSISMIADTTNGIEPVFALVYEKKVTAGSFFYVDSVFEERLRDLGLYNDEMLKKISENYGSIQGIEEIPKELHNIFVTSMDIHWLDHLVAQAVLQRCITDSISKTINMPNDISVDDIQQAYIIAHEMGCKGVTVYRDGSKTKQVLNVLSAKKELMRRAEPSDFAMEWLNEIISKKEWIKRYIKMGEAKIVEVQPPVVESEEVTPSVNHEEKKLIVPSDAIERCPTCGGEHLVYEAGCMVCKDCGWSECIIS
ncbi:MAG TPA: adenosylcobalamin-dependent ribonucleoside-diphosphate reductase [Thermoplasmatales archaeon]|nr:adenosylcobalamin-dependent ribonucleoside-diphosphate reductase [Thermoplasmatales archaeon]